jgi:hypothetical protein
VTAELRRTFDGVDRVGVQETFVEGSVERKAIAGGVAHLPTYGLRSISSPTLPQLVLSIAAGIAGVRERDGRVRAEREKFLLPGAAVRQAPELRTVRLSLELQSASVRQLLQTGFRLRVATAVSVSTTIELPDTDTAFSVPTPIPTNVAAARGTPRKT